MDSRPLRWTAERHPDRRAVGGPRTPLTYAEWDARTDAARPRPRDALGVRRRRPGRARR